MLNNGGETFSPKIFLSYNTKDKKTVDLVKGELEKRGIKFFYDRDELRPGDLWEPLIAQGIAESSAFAVFWGSDIGEYQRKELLAALDRFGTSTLDRSGNKLKEFRIIPILLIKNPSPVLERFVFIDLSEESEQLLKLDDLFKLLSDQSMNVQTRLGCFDHDALYRRLYIEKEFRGLRINGSVVLFPGHCVRDQFSVLHSRPDILSDDWAIVWKQIHGICDTCSSPYWKFYSEFSTLITKCLDLRITDNEAIGIKISSLRRALMAEVKSIWSEILDVRFSNLDSGQQSVIEIINDISKYYEVICHHLHPDLLPKDSNLPVDERKLPPLQNLVDNISGLWAVCLHTADENLKAYFNKQASVFT